MISGGTVLLQKICAHCAGTFDTRRDAAKYCSRACSARAVGPTLRAVDNTTCTQCGKGFHIKESQKRRYARTHGYFCSVACHSIARKSINLGSGNPNYKGRNYDSDGYRLHVPSSPHVLGFKRMKLHTAVALEALGVPEIPKGLHVHHRDCNVENNAPTNLAVLSISDHKWLHKQFGSATLWAFMQGKVKLAALCSWSDDPARAKRLLALDVTHQSAGDLVGLLGN